MTCAKIIACFEEAGLPAGVINLVTGPGSVVGQGLAEHDGVNAVTFTGSNQVGKIIGQAALARGAKYQLEMGGKNPVIVADDADLEAAAEAVITGPSVQPARNAPRQAVSLYKAEFMSALKKNCSSAQKILQSETA